MSTHGKNADEITLKVESDENKQHRHLSCFDSESALRLLLPLLSGKLFIYQNTPRITFEHFIGN